MNDILDEFESEEGEDDNLERTFDKLDVKPVDGHYQAGDIGFSRGADAISQTDAEYRGKPSSDDPWKTHNDLLKDK